MARTKKKARKKSRRKKTGSKGFNLSKIIPFKPVFIALLCSIVIGGAVFGVKYFFMNSKFFSIKEILVNKDQGYASSGVERRIKKIYLGRNIFSVNLRQVQILIAGNFPQLRKVEVVRRLPNTMEVDIIYREPIAVIDYGGGVVIDQEAVVLTIGEETQKLIKIKGLSFFLNMPSRGEQLENAQLGRAILLLQAVKKKLRAQVKNIGYIDISDKNNVILGIYGAKVKMGIDDFFVKIDALREIVNDPDIKMKDIKYIDLRFEDAVISLK